LDIVRSVVGAIVVAAVVVVAGVDVVAEEGVRDKHCLRDPGLQDFPILLFLLLTLSEFLQSVS